MKNYDLIEVAQVKEETLRELAANAYQACVQLDESVGWLMNESVCDEVNDPFRATEDVTAAVLAYHDDL